MIIFMTTLIIKPISLLLNSDISLTHWCRDEMDSITQQHFQTYENIWISNKISLKFVTKSSTNNIPALVQIMFWCHPCNKILSEPMMVSLPTHICVTRPIWVNTGTMGLLPDTLNYGLRMLREFWDRFPRQHGLAIPTCITARAWRTCREACRDR